MNKIKLTCIICFLSVFYTINAQKDSSYNRIISFLPQYVFNNGMRFDYEKKLTPRAWLQVMFEGYAMEKNDYSTSWREEYSYDLAGIGIGCNYKWYVDSDPSALGTYIAPGICYNFFKSDNYDPTTSPETKSATTIHKVGAHLTIGYQFFVADRLLIDFYTGLGFRKAFNHYSNSSASRNFKFDDNMINYGYSGNTLLLGVRFGYLF